MIDAFDLVLRLAHVNVHLERVERRNEFVAHVAVCLRHDELIDVGQGLVLIVVPEHFEISHDPLIEHLVRADIQPHPTGIDFHLLVAFHDAVVRLHHRRNAELAA